MYLIQEDTALPFRYMRNAWFFGLPTFGLGFIGAKIDWNKKSWYRYIYLLLAIGFFFLQIVEHNLIAPSINRLEMYITGIISSFFFLQFFLSFKKANCKFYYKWIGKSASFYIYILHMLVSVSIRNLISIENSYLYVLIVFLVSFLIYEIVFLLKKLYFVLIKKVNF